MRSVSMRKSEAALCAESSGPGACVAGPLPSTGAPEASVSLGGFVPGSGAVIAGWGVTTGCPVRGRIADRHGYECANAVQFL